ncbi:CU044_5270 family protein [Nonomuraea rhodomycinica]|uniref:CU044_5270 family protein n=1 Tax=Nonomuraea rhodomycinica TaxID=1712872 RepID=A0A7Y6ITF4_9ACTN|nr:CU044_5270 family protein [Nonomuraea rhodomycinica]NUW43783.1 CU044_5270 family protein [Nonomuraea rhodomycinica]
MTDLNGRPFPGLPDDRTDLDAVRALLGSPEPSLETVVDGRARLLAALARDTGDTVGDTGPLADAGPYAGVGAGDAAPAEIREEPVPLRAVHDHAPRTAGRMRRRLATAGAGLAAAATILVAAVVAAPGGPVTSTGPGAPATTAQDPPSASSTTSAGAGKARAVLLAAADAVAGQPAGQGAYWRTTTVTWWQTPTGDGAYVLELGLSEEMWLARRPGDKSWRIKRPLGAKPATASDEAAWRKAGSPSSWNMGPSGAPAADVVEAKPGEPVVSELRGTWRGSGGDLAKQSLSWDDLAAIPGDVDGLRAYLTRLVTETGAKGSADDPEKLRDLLGEAAVRIAADLPVTPRVRASAFRLLATMPGVRAEGQATDRLGREGQAIVYRSDGRVKARIVVDPRTGRTLARQTTTLDTARDGGEIPLHAETAYERIGWTDQRPPGRR